jgi:NAD(P)-dependent dehydrogenase (short-subunit alcohol dehydrogenase family)
LSLKGKIYTITGFIKGIGFDIAKDFAENDGSTVMVGLNIKNTYKSPDTNKR